MSLRDLDEKWVPRLAEKVDSVARLFPKAPEPTGPLPVILRLRQVDDRWTAAGPLALIRDVPQVGAFVLALLVLVGSIVAFSRSDDRRQPPAAAPGAEAPLGEDDLEEDDGTLGPTIGQKIDEYVAESREEILRVAPTRPDATVLAVVSLAQYQTPEAVAELLGTTMQVQVVFFKVPGPTGILHDEPVQDLAGDTRRAFERAAKQRLAAAKEMLDFAKTIENDPAQKSEHEKDAALIQQEVRALRGTCKCVVALVVRARLRTLLDALNLRTFRAIEISKVDAKLGDYDKYTALTPEEKDTFSGGNRSN